MKTGMSYNPLFDASSLNSWKIRMNGVGKVALCIALTLLFLANSATAAPFSQKIQFTQPDGTAIELWGQGDEFYAVFETLDGYTVIFDPAVKAYFYATMSADGSDLISSGIQVGKDNPNVIVPVKHLRKSPALAKKEAKERFDKWDQGTDNTKRWNALKVMRQKEKKTGEKNGVLAAPSDGTGIAADGIMMSPPSFTTTGTKTALCLLIDFEDDPAPVSIPQAQIETFCNSDSSSVGSNNGSVKKYFSDVSNGTLNYTNVVTAYVRIPNSLHPKSYYNDTSKDCGDQANELIKDAIAILKTMPDYTVNFDKLDTDASGNVLCTNVFYAGGNGGRWMFGLWPHSWSLYNVGAQDLGAGGKKVYNYQITNIGTSLELGTFCHENGHMLCDFPDIYDYGYDSIGGAGMFCLMNSGGHGTNPVQVCAYLKLAAGWGTTTELTSTSTITASLDSAGANFNLFYRYQKPGVPTEYFLIENRQRSGRDADIPASGLAVWHVDELGNKDNQSLTPNSNHLNYEVTLVQADNLWHFQNDVNYGDSNDLYYSGNTAEGYANRLDDNSSPNAHWWDSSSSGMVIQNISASATTMTFATNPPYPNISVRGNGVLIANGSLIPSTANNTDFGIPTGPISKTYFIYNTGDLALHLTGSPDLVAISGVNAGDFTVSTQPTSPVAPGDGASFEITFTPSASGIRTATVRIANNVAGKNPYTFAIQGEGSVGIDIKGNGISIANGNSIPSTANGTDFGSLPIGWGSLENTYTVHSTAALNLNLTGSPDLVVISGVNASDFTVTSLPSTPVAGGNSTSFRINFVPSALGIRTATVTIANNVSEKNPYTFTIQGRGINPGTIQFRTTDFNVNEYDVFVKFTVERTEGSDGQVSVTFSTIDGSAIAGEDYIAKSGTLSWPAGFSAPQTFEVKIKKDVFKESDETFTVELSDASVARLGANTVVVITILDNDHILTVSANENGTTNPSGITHVEKSGWTNISAIPNQYYHFVNWDFTGDVVVTDPNSANTSIIYSGNGTATANFAYDDPYENNTAVLTMAVSGAGTTSPEVGSSFITNATSTLITATESGSTFAGWSVKGNAVVANTESIRTMVTIYGDATVTANFISGTVESLTDNVPESPLSDIKGGRKFFKITVPESSPSLNVTTTTTKTITDATAANPCVITATAHGFATGDTVLINGITGTMETILNGKFFVITKVNDNAFSVLVDTTGETSLPGGTVTGIGGDCDIYARFAAVPTLGDYYAKSTNLGTSEAINILNPIAGTWYVMVYGYEEYSGVSLLATIGTDDPGKVTGFAILNSPPAKTDRVAMSWTAVAGATGYEVWRSDVNNVGLARKLSDLTESFYEDFLSSSGEFHYYYWVRAVNSVGPGEFSYPVYGTNLTAGSTVLKSGTAVTAISGNAGSVKTYIITVPDALQTYLEVNVSGGTGDCDIDVVQPNGMVLKKSIHGSNNELVQISGNPITKGNWLINVYGQTNYSGVTILAKYTKAILAPPAGLTASKGLFEDRILLSWTAFTGVTSYEIYKIKSETVPKTPPTQEDLISEVSDNTYEDVNVLSGSYYYFVKAKNALGTSTLSAGIPGYLMKAPVVPATVTASNTYFDKITVTWAKVIDATSYEIFRNPTRAITNISIAPSCAVTAPGHGFSTGDTVLINGVMGTMSTLLNGKSLLVTVTDINSFTFTTPVNTTGKTYLSGGTGTAIPARPIAKIDYNSTLASYTYNDVATLATPEPTPANTYNYWVTAVNGNGPSPLKITASPGFIKKTGPATVTASQGTFADKIRITWAAVSGATDYEVTDKNGTNVTVVSGLTYDYADTDKAITGITPSNPCIITVTTHGFASGDTVLINGVTGTMSTLLNAKSLVVTKVDDNTFTVPVNTIEKTYVSGGTATGKHNFKVRANWKSGASVLYTSDFSPICTGYVYANTLTSLAAPLMKSVSKGEGAFVKITWGEVPLAVSYNLYRKINTTDSWGILQGGITAFTHTDLTAVAGQTYMYAVTAVNGAAGSPYSASMSGYAAVALAAPVIIENAFASPALQGWVGNQKFYQIIVPSGVSRLVVKAEKVPVTGSCDLYAKLGMYPTTTSFNAKGTAITGTANKTLTVTNPAQGTWFVMLYGAGTSGYTYANFSINYYTSTDIVLTQIPANDLAVPFTVNFKGKVVDETGITGIGGLSIQVRNPITGIISWLPEKTDASGYFTYSALINTEGEHTFDFFFTTMPDSVKGTASHTVATRKGCLEANGFFDLSAYLPATPIALSQTDVIGMQTFLDIRNGWADGVIDTTTYEPMWIKNTVVAASTDTALLGKLDEGLYMFFYGVEGAGAGNDTTANSALSMMPFVVHVASSKLETVVVNLNDLGIIDNTQKDAILIDGKIGLVAVAAHSNPGEGAVDGDKNISLLAREQLEVLANLAAGTATENLLAPEGNKYSDVITEKFSVDLNGGTKKLNVKTSAFVK